MVSNANKNNRNFLAKIIIVLLVISCLFFLARIINPNTITTIKSNVKSFTTTIDNDTKKNDEVDKGKWIVVEDVMDKPRVPATANLLPDGNVLIMGGQDNSADTAEIFNPNQMKIIKSISLNDKRYYDYLSISLKNGDVLIAGGYIFPNNMAQHTNSVKLFDSKKYIFKNLKPMENNNEIGILLKNNNILFLNNIINQGAKDRDKMRFEVYNPQTDSYYKTQNMISRIKVSRKEIFILENGDVLFGCYGAFPNERDKPHGAVCRYSIEENKFNEYYDLPLEQLFIQLDSENYLTIKPEETSSSGYVYNIKTKKRTPVSNKIPKTWRAGIIPQFILLDNGNVLILGIILENNSTKYEITRKNRSTAKYSAYIYDRKGNNFYEVQPPPYPVYDAGIVKLKNGDILVAGGKIKYNKFSNKIQIFKYKH